MSIFTKIFGDPNKKVIDDLTQKIPEINAWEEKLQKLTDEELAAKTIFFQEKIKNGGELAEILTESFATVREASIRTAKQPLEYPVGAAGLRHFDVQMVGGLVLHQGKIAEMKTGEGKTLVATLPVYLNALTKKGVHVVTVNDYLARRDTLWMGPIYHFLGLSVGCIQHDQAFLFDPHFRGANESAHFLKPISRREAYAADITYGTNNEFGFDYLRDNMVRSLAEKVQRELNYAIVDEIDSILIDEARTPLIISAPAEDATEQYYRFAQLVQRLSENEDYNRDEKMRAVTLTEKGMNKMEQLLGVTNIYEAGGMTMAHHIEQALKAHALFKKDRDYIVKDGEVIIVDEFTGRLMYGRRYSEGLHQAIEAKENANIKQESRTLATITFQNYFRLYKKLAGMTGTATTEAEEFHKIYNLDVIEVPTYRNMVRKDFPDKIYKNEQGKFKALAQDIKKKHEQGQPVLVGTISIEKNEILSELLQKEGVPHEMLNAKNHEKEASIIAQAGKFGAVTVATNMAGRGTDIVLGGNPPDKEEAEKIRTVGGLAVLGSERHEARRIDNQLRGRSGRLGDPGVSQFYVSMEDDLMRIFGSNRVGGLMERLGIPDDMPIENKIVSRSMESAQKKVEGHNFDIRKHLVEYDDVMNKHREVIYNRRNKILSFNKEDVQKEMKDLIAQEIETVISFHTSLENEREWNLKEIYEVVNTIFPVDPADQKNIQSFTEGGQDKLQEAEGRTKLIKHFIDLSEKAYLQLQAKIANPELFFEIERSIMLRAIDVLWIEHLDTMQHLREGIGLRGYGQRDPLIEYKKEGYQLFTELIGNINKEIVYSLFKTGAAHAISESPMTKGQQILQAPKKTMEDNENPSVTQKVRNDEGDKIGRNDPCFCGSGKKYKKCHGA